MNWWLVFAAGASFLGPMQKYECDAARQTFKSAECRQAVMMWCAVDGRPGTARSCPDFSTDGVGSVGSMK